VKLSSDARRLLERLQAELAEATGRRYTLQEIADASIRLAAAQKERLMEELGAWRPLSPEEAERLLDELAVDAPVEDVEEDMRMVLYGSAAAGHRRDTGGDA